MSYRNDRDADLARIEALEHELGNANRTIARLERPAAKPQPPERGPTQARPPPSTLRVQEPVMTTELGYRIYTFPCEIPTARCVDAMQAIRAADGSPDGQLQIERPGWMTWRGRSGSIEILVENGRTRMSCFDRTPGPGWAVVAGVAVAVLLVAEIAKRSEFAVLIVGTLAAAALIAAAIAVACAAPTKDRWAELCERTAQLLVQGSAPQDPPRR